MLEVKRPIFITGTGRCGSTVFHHMLSHHAEVTWLSRICEINPRASWANRWAIRALDLPGLARCARRLIYPVEAYRFWEYCCPGFSEPCRDLTKEDVTPRLKEAVRSAMLQLLTQRRQRLLIKITGWPRMGFLREMFQDAKFIHIHRDGRAVANSLLSTPFWSGWRGPANWRWGELAPEQREKWERYGRSFVALAGIEWEILMAAQDSAKQSVPPGDLLEVRYEDLCRAPDQVLRRAVEFSGLDWSSKLETTIWSFSLRNANDRWQRQLSGEQQRILCECLADSLKRYGYV